MYIYHISHITEHVGVHVVPDDEAHGQEEPDHALKHVFDHARRREHDEQQRDVRPAKLGELVLVGALFEREDEGDEAHAPVVAGTLGVLEQAL